MNTTVPERRSVGSRLRLGWDWYTDLGFGAWVIGVVVVLALGLGIAVLVGHGESRDTSCSDASSYASLMARYDDTRLTAPQAARLQKAVAPLQAASESANGQTRRVLAEMAQVAGTATAGQTFDAGFAPGRFQSVCDYSGQGPGLRP